MLGVFAAELGVLKINRDDGVVWLFGVKVVFEDCRLGVLRRGVRRVGVLIAELGLLEVVVGMVGIFTGELWVLKLVLGVLGVVWWFNKFASELVRRGVSKFECFARLLLEVNVLVIVVVVVVVVVGP